MDRYLALNEVTIHDLRLSAGGGFGEGAGDQDAGQVLAIFAAGADVGGGAGAVGGVRGGVGGCRAAGVEAALAGGAAPADAAAHAADGTGAASDIRASREYREHLARVLVSRALTEAASRA